LLFLALALVGAPFTSGAVAKYALKPVIEGADWPWVAAAVTVSTVGTTLLMGRLIWVSAGTSTHSAPGYLWPGIAWALLIALVALFPFVLGKATSWTTNSVAVPLGVVLATLVALAAWRNPDWLKPLIGLIPAGDLIVLSRPIGALVKAFGGWLWRPLGRSAARIARFAIDRYERVCNEPPGDVERGLRAWSVAGALWIGILALLVLALLSGEPLVDNGEASDQVGIQADSGRQAEAIANGELPPD
jgi:hypothetical protein